MKKTKSKYRVLIIIAIIILLLAGLGGLLYWKMGRIIKSISDSAKKASSQNTPLSD